MDKHAYKWNNWWMWIKRLMTNDSNWNRTKIRKSLNIAIDKSPINWKDLFCFKSLVNTESSSPVWVLPDIRKGLNVDQNPLATGYWWNFFLGYKISHLWPKIAIVWAIFGLSQTFMNYCWDVSSEYVENLI